jgi:hypothetical protein
MSTQNPKKNLEQMEKVLNAWRDMAPDATFGGVTLAEFQALVQSSVAARAAVTDAEMKVLQEIIKRDNADAQTLKMRELVVNGVVGDPAFGNDSALYEAMGYIRKSDRKSGLTRKSVAAKLRVGV